MATIEMDVEVYCNQCDIELTVSSVNGETIYVEPCEHCTDGAYNEGMRDAGHEGEE